MDVSFPVSEQTIARLRQIQALLNQLDPAAPPRAVVVPDSPQPRGSIIVFPGAFNPPTKAHLGMLRQAWRYANQHAPMLVYAAFSKVTVDKEAVERPLLLDRVLLLSEVLQKELPYTGIMLFNRGLYVEQAEAVRVSFPAVREVFFLIGFDKIVQILDERYYKDRNAALKELFSLAQLLVAPRGKGGAEQLAELLNRPENRMFAPFIHELPLSRAYRNVSSTSVRQHLEAHRSDVPPEVEEFIRTTHAYEPPTRLPDGTERDYYGERVKALQQLLKNASA
jgi:nicotinic acid mononucleotide adenylyltransferase